MADLEKQFDQAMLDVYLSAKSDCGYVATDFFNMLSRYRGLITAKRLLASDNPQYGFTKLHECGRLDLTVECLVLDPKYSDLFDEAELAQARKRLKTLKFDPAQCEEG